MAGKRAWSEESEGDMTVMDLQKWGIPSRIIDIWNDRQGSRLLPVQSKAVRKGLLGMEGQDLSRVSLRTLVSAPTGSGKSFCAEMAMIQALTSRQKTVLLYPLKSLAEQKYRVLEETYAPLGIKCIIATGDHPENDALLARGEYQVAVVIYEKFDLLLTANLDALGGIGLIVIDEIQTIAEPKRGAVLERLLTKVISSVYTPSLVGLSAVIGDSDTAAGRLADWLGATLIEETTRPVDLLRGVAAEGSFRYRSYNDGVDGSEPFETPEAGDEPFESFANQLRKEAVPTLVFLKSRRETIDCAFKLAASVAWAPAEQAIEELKAEEPSFLIRTLTQTLSRGVGFHSADLSSRQRTIVENAFTRHDIMVLFSTTTLAMGVDLPAERVLLETVKYTDGTYAGSPLLVPISLAEFDNITGRAGRLGLSGDFPGRAIVLAVSEFDRDVLWRNYIMPETSAPIRSALGSLPLEDWVLNMAVAGVACARTDLDSLFANTLYAAVGPVDDSVSIVGGLSPDFDTALQCLQDRGLVRLELDDTIIVTPLGRTVALIGLSVRQAGFFQQKLNDHRPESLEAWLALALSAPDWEPPAGMLTRLEQVGNGPAKLLWQHYDHLVDAAAMLIGRPSNSEPLGRSVAVRLKGLLMLCEWISMTPVKRLEERFQAHLGQIMNLGDQAAHLVMALRRLDDVGNRQAGSNCELEGLVFGLRFGLVADLRELYGHFGSSLVRSDFVALKEAGLVSLRDVFDCSSERLREIIDNARKFMSFMEKVEILKQEVDMQSNVGTEERVTARGPVLVAQPESIIVDGSYERERYLVRIDGFPVRLTGKSFKYFTKLAWGRLCSDGGWIYKEDIEMGFNQARYLYRMKNEIAAGLGMSWPVFENNRLGYYRLQIDPTRIDINVENLRDHPDYELRDMISGRESGPVN
ncbi:MAG: DEAD/DEAH box helicase [candidate division Zixibacteria bacterium]|nr:DEAD/DEAH box helicase [candidate division Zixibacteria bacterium]